MHGPEILIPLGFFTMVTAISIGVPLAKAWARRLDRESAQPRIPGEVSERLERMEQALDSIAIEVERISEGQRFTTKLLADRTRDASAIPVSPDSR